MENIQTAQEPARRPGRKQLIMRFLKGSKAFFIICMVCAAVSALADMLTPQIIRITVDQVLLGEPADSLSPVIRRGLEALGGAERLRGATVHKLLKDWGMPVRLDGAAYFIEAAVHCHGDALLLKNLSKGLYTQLSQRMDTTVSRIERSMRSAIAIAYDRGTLGQCFDHRPSNREFIEYLMNAVDQSAHSHAL